MDEVLTLIGTDLITRPNSILMGDFNIQFNEDEDPEVLGFKDMMQAIGLDQHVHFYMQNKGNTLDQIYTVFNPCPILFNVCQQQFLSDHCLIMGLVKLQKEKPKMKQIEMRDIANMDKDQFKKLLDTMLTKMDFLGTVNMLVICFEAILNSLMDIFAPIK